MRNTGHYEWFYLFIIEGILTMFFALVTFLIIPQSIRSAWFLTEDEKNVGEARILADSAESLSNTFKWSEALLEFKSPHPYIRIIIAITYSTLLNSNNNFLAIIVGRLGYSTVKTNLVSSSSTTGLCIHLMFFVVHSCSGISRGGFLGGCELLFGLLP